MAYPPNQNCESKMNIALLILTIMSCGLSFIWIKEKLQNNQYDPIQTNVFGTVLTLALYGTAYILSTFTGLDTWIALTIKVFVWTALNMKYHVKLPKSFWHFDTRWSLLLLASVLTFIFQHHKWGGWDAYSIWNMHAKFLFDQENWQNMFKSTIEWTHPDYPLLLPSIIAAFWKTMGHITPVIPASFALVVYICINSLIFNKIKALPYISVLVLTTLFLGYDYVNIASSEYADSFIALVFLIVIILFLEKPKHYLILAGLFCGIALSIKNEGFVIYAVILIFTFFKERYHTKSVLIVGLASLPFLLILLYFKWFLAPANDIVSGQSISTLERILSPMRYFHIIRFGLETLFTKYYMLLIIVILSHKYWTAWHAEYWVIIMILMAYLAVYIITPKDLIWHLSTSMKRLFHHLYPALLYLILSSTDLKKWDESLAIFYYKLFGRKSP